MSTSKSAALAARSSTPLRRPIHPSSRAVDTSRCASSRAKICATDSSRSIRKIQYSLSRHREDRNSLLPPYGRERIQKVFECVPGFQVIKEVGNNDARPDENRLAAHDLRIAVNHLTGRHRPRIPRMIEGG